MRQTILFLLFILSENSAFSATPREIRYVLPEPAHVTIAVEDAQGNRVRNLVADAPREAGECAEAWDGCDDAEIAEVCPSPRPSLTRRHKFSAPLRIGTSDPPALAAKVAETLQSIVIGGGPALETRRAFR